MQKLRRRNTLLNHTIYSYRRKCWKHQAYVYWARFWIPHYMLRESGKTSQKTCVYVNMGIRKITKYGPHATSELFIFQGWRGDTEDLEVVWVTESYFTYHVSSASVPDIQEALYKDISNSALNAAEFHFVSSDYTLPGHNVLRFPTDQTLHALST
jgi:hypothetical protein